MFTQVSEGCVGCSRKRNREVKREGGYFELNDNGIYRLSDGREFLVRAGIHGGYTFHDIQSVVASARLYLIEAPDSSSHEEDRLAESR
jgi:hypothetical protein